MTITVGEEVERTVYDFPVELGEPEKSALLEHAMETITTDEMDELLLGWVMVKILQEELDRFELSKETLNTPVDEEK